MNAKRFLSALLSTIMVLSMIVPAIVGSSLSDIINSPENIPGTNNNNTSNNTTVLPSLPSGSEVNYENLNGAFVSVTGENTAKPGQTVDLTVTMSVTARYVYQIGCSFSIVKNKSTSPAATYTISNYSLPYLWQVDNQAFGFSASARDVDPSYMNSWLGVPTDSGLSNTDVSFVVSIKIPEEAVDGSVYTFQLTNVALTSYQSGPISSLSSISYPISVDKNATPLGTNEIRFNKSSLTVGIGHLEEVTLRYGSQLYPSLITFGLLRSDIAAIQSSTSTSVTLYGLRAGTDTLIAYYNGKPYASMQITVSQYSDVTVTPVSGQYKYYGDEDPVFEYYTTPSNVKLVGLLTRTAGEDAGTYAIRQGTVTDQYNPGYTINFTGTVKFEILQRPLTDNKITVTLSQYEYTENGKYCQPDVTVKHGNTVLKEGTDYTVSYKDNYFAGTASVIIEAVKYSNYSGKVTKEFTIKSSKTAVESISLDTYSKTLNVGKSFTLVATVSPDNATDKSVEWYSSDSTIASVTQDGVVLAKKEGTAVITVVAKDGSFRTACVVTVKGAAVDEEALLKKFKDLEKGSWYIPYISYVVENGIYNGTSDNTFEPLIGMKRSMFLAALCKIGKIDVSLYYTDEFSDLDEGAWYIPYIAWAVEHGITDGYSDGTFRPDELITREQMCYMIIRYCKYKGDILIKNLNYYDEELFADHDKITQAAVPSVYRCKALGIVEGRDGNVFDPAATANRAEAAAMLMRFHMLLVDAGHDTDNDK